MNIINQTVLLRVSLIFILIVSSITNSFSQLTDSSTIVATSYKKDTVTEKHSPKKAMLMSVCLPGLGQIYNKKYWKVPVIYVGFAALGYAFYQYETLYSNFHNAWKNRLEGNPDPYTGKLSTDALFGYQQTYNKDRQMALIGIGLLYMINIIDASVDAHLFDFDVSDNLSLNIQPKVLYIASTNHYQTGLSLNFKF